MEKYKIFGSEMSPYSIKVRAYVRFKKIPHQWINRSKKNRPEFNKLAKIPLIPLVLSPSGEVLQDSTPIIEALEELFLSPSIVPDAPVLKFLSILLEEFGDEWVNKIMFHNRWWNEVDQASAARILAMSSEPEEETNWGEIEAGIKTRMIGRREFVGSSEGTAGLIDEYRDSLIACLEKHFQNRSYLFGERPCLGDFGIASEIYELSSDPTGSGLLRSRAPKTLAWAYRMLEPREDGPYESWEELMPTLRPILREVGQLFLPWSSANREALDKNEANFSVELKGKVYTQQPQKYHAKSLQVLRDKFSQFEDDLILNRVLEETSCLRWLT